MKIIICCGFDPEIIPWLVVPLIRIRETTHPLIDLVEVKIITSKLAWNGVRWLCVRL